MSWRSMQRMAAACLMAAALALGLPGSAAATPAPGNPGGQTADDPEVDLSGTGEQGAGLDPNGRL